MFVRAECDLATCLRCPLPDCAFASEAKLAKHRVSALQKHLQRFHGAMSRQLLDYVLCGRAVKRKAAIAAAAASEQGAAVAGPDTRARDRRRECPHCRATFTRLDRHIRTMHVSRLTRAMNVFTCRVSWMDVFMLDGARGGSRCHRRCDEIAAHHQHYHDYAECRDDDDSDGGCYSRPGLFGG